MTSETFKSSIVNMVVQNSVPLTFFSDTPFRSLNGEIAEKFKISLNRENIKNLILEEYNTKKSNLIKEIRDKPIF